METIAMQNKAYEDSMRNASPLDKLVEYITENSREILCGILSMTGANVYPIYKALQY